MQVAANPYVAALGPEEGASSRLNLSQAFNSLGTSLAPIAGSILILSDRIKTAKEIEGLTNEAKEVYLVGEAAAVQLPFVVLALIIGCIALVFSFVSLPQLIQKSPGKKGYLVLFKNKWVMLGAFGILVYVGAEVAVGSYLINYFMDMGLVAQIKNTPLMNKLAAFLLNANLDLKDNKAIVGAFVTFYWSGAMVGRFFGAYLTKRFNPARVLAFFALGACVLAFVSLSTNGFISMWSVLGIGFFNSIMFPTIFTLALGGLNDLKPQASGILCSMIVGGALIPPAFGMVTDNFGFKPAFGLIILCYSYILFYGWLNTKR